LVCLLCAPSCCLLHGTHQRRFFVSPGTPQLARFSPQSSHIPVGIWLLMRGGAWPACLRAACVLAGWLLQASCGAGWLHGCLILRLRPLAAGALPAAGWLLLLFPLFRLFDERSRTPNALRALRHPPPLLHLASYTRTLPAPP
jgi:hypothetical protein